MDIKVEKIDHPIKLWDISEVGNKPCAVLVLGDQKLPDESINETQAIINPTVMRMVDYIPAKTKSVVFQQGAKLQKETEEWCNETESRVLTYDCSNFPRSENKNLHMMINCPSQRFCAELRKWYPDQWYFYINPDYPNDMALQLIQEVRFVVVCPPSDPRVHHYHTMMHKSTEEECSVVSYLQEQIGVPYYNDFRRLYEKIVMTDRHSIVIDMMKFHSDPSAQIANYIYWMPAEQRPKCIVKNFVLETPSSIFASDLDENLGLPKEPVIDAIDSEWKRIVTEFDASIRSQVTGGMRSQFLSGNYINMSKLPYKHRIILYDSICQRFPRMVGRGCLFVSRNGGQQSGADAFITKSAEEFAGFDMFLMRFLRE